MIQTIEEIKQAGLIFSSDSKPGFYRKGTVGNFYYIDASGNKISEVQHLERIQKLVLPPAWTDVWISKSANGYLQAVGIDKAGRKQYRYHAKWTYRRSDSKYYKLLEFGKVLPKARQRINKDIKRKKFDEVKVLAICLKLMQKSLIRIGNENYKQLYGTYGLTTLRDKHFKVNGSKFTLNFIGKKGVEHNVEYNDKLLARLIKKCKDIPGQELFQFYTDDHARHPIGSQQINNYIKEITGSDFTAKDFRTWGGTLEAMRQLAFCQQTLTEELPKNKIIVKALDCVAKKLGNTRAVCKSSYVYPALLKSYEEGTLDTYLKKINSVDPNSANEIEQHEKILMQFLKKVC